MFARQRPGVEPLTENLLRSLFSPLASQGTSVCPCLCRSLPVYVSVSGCLSLSLPLHLSLSKRGSTWFSIAWILSLANPRRVTPSPPLSTLAVLVKNNSVHMVLTSRHFDRTFGRSLRRSPPPEAHTLGEAHTLNPKPVERSGSTMCVYRAVLR